MEHTALMRITMSDQEFRESIHYTNLINYIKNGFGDLFTTTFLKVLAKHKVDSVSKFYMVTFTIDPNKFPAISEEQTLEIEKLVHSQGLRRGLFVKHYSVVREYTKEGAPHWHALLETSRSLKPSNFAYYQANYGFIHLGLTTKNTDLFIKEYMEKTGAPVVTII